MKYDKKKNLKQLLALLCGAVLLLAACAPAAAGEEAPQMLTFRDDLGRTISLDGYPDRIVSTSPSLTEMLYFVGAGDTLVGRDDFSVYPDEALEAPSFGSLFTDIPAETILGMEPDLVLAAEIISSEQVQALEDLGLTVYWQSNPENFEDLYANILDMAALVGKSEAAAPLVSELGERVVAVEMAVAGAEETPLVFYELDGTDPNNPWTAGSGTFVDLVVNAAGGANAAATLQGDYAQISVEALIQQNPDFIILGDSDFGMTPEIVAARGGWDGMKAVQNGYVFPFNSNLLSVPGPRLVDGLEQIARIIHPDLFP
jgi:iron complex transport system substrate-binding protein